jgi:diacylglycerol O-acyltransferase
MFMELAPDRAGGGQIDQRKKQDRVREKAMEQQQLSGIDASFLYLETAETPMHVAGLTYFELPPGFEGSFYLHFRKFFKSRLHTIPIFSKRLAPSLYDLDHPGWVEEEEIDLDYHLRETTLPAPGSDAQLEEVISRLSLIHI